VIEFDTRIVYVWQACSADGIAAARSRGRSLVIELSRIHAMRSQLLELLPPLSFAPSLAAFCVDESRNVQSVQVAAAAISWKGKHQSTLIQWICDEFARTTVKRKRVKDGEEPSKHHLETSDSGMYFGHDEDEAFGSGFWL